MEEIVKMITAINPLVFLSGSLAINMQGLKTKRTPEDIDLWIPDTATFVPIKGMLETDNGDRYEERDHHRVTYKYEGVSIDVFTPVYGNKYYPIATYCNGLSVILVEDIVKFKIEHAFSGTRPEGQVKHCEDIIFILNQIYEKAKEIVNIENSIGF